MDFCISQMTSLHGLSAAIEKIYLFLFFFSGEHLPIISPFEAWKVPPIFRGHVREGMCLSFWCPFPPFLSIFIMWKRRFTIRPSDFLLVWFGFRLLLQDFSLLHMDRKDFKSCKKSHMYVPDTDF